ncbi:hypothetical protein Tco_1129931 [Tanacetum coccineum]
MGRDTIQLDDAVSTISEEYLMEFTSEYGIPEDLHPEFPGLEDTIVDFPKGKVEMDLFNLISAPNPAKVKTGTRPRAAYEVPLLTATTNRVIDMDTIGASGSSGKSSTMEKSSLDFADEDLPPPNTEGVRTEEQMQDELSEGRGGHHAPPMNKRRKQIRRKRANDEAEANAPPKVLRKDHVSSPAHSSYGGKSLAAMGLGAGSISSTPSAQGALTATKSVSDPDPLSYAKPQPYPEQDIAQSSRGTATEIPTEHVATTEVNVQLSVGSPELGKSTYVPSVVGSPGVAMGSQLRLRFEQEVRLLKKARAKIARQDQRIQVREEVIKKLDQEVKSFRATETEVHGLRNQTKNLETLLEAEADMKKAAEAKNAELTKELESLRVRFSDLQVNNNQLSQQVSNFQEQITGEEKIKAAFEEFKKFEDDRVKQYCAEMDARLLRQAFANVVSVGLVKGMSKGLEHGIEHGKDGRDLEAVEAYDPKAYSKYLKALQELKDLKNPWAIKEEILLEDAIAANMSRAEKKKKCRVVCRTHGVGSTHHTRSDGVPVLAPTVAPQGLAILLVDAAIQTENKDAESMAVGVATLLHGKQLLGFLAFRYPKISIVLGMYYME